LSITDKKLEHNYATSSVKENRSYLKATKAISSKFSPQGIANIKSSRLVIIITIVILSFINKENMNFTTKSALTEQWQRQAGLI
jgi:hypothetical protein